MKLTGEVDIRKGAAVIGGKVYPRGSVSFYTRKGAKGLKIFYGLENGMKTTGRRAASIFKHMKELYKEGFGVKAYALTSVKLNLAVKGKKVKQSVPAIKVRHLEAKGPKKALVIFRKKLAGAAKRHDYLDNDDTFKSNNIMYDRKASSWRLVDVR